MTLERDAVWWRWSWNNVLRVVSWLRAQPDVLQVDRLLAEASRQSALDDFGEMDFLAPMRVLIREFDAGAHSDLFGRQLFAHMLVGSLRNRLALRQAGRDNPQLTRQPIESPVVILGLPRTGTTLLQGLLASVASLRTPLRWETELAAVPSSPTDRSGIDARIKRTQNDVDFATWLSPRLPDAHPAGALLPEECNPLMMTAFRSLLYATLFPCPDYQDFLYETRFAHAYDWHKLHLQLLAHGNPPRTWLLKCPAHMASIGELLRVYPDARVVFTHRNPEESVPSMCALAARLRKVVAPALDRDQIGREFMRNLAAMENAAHAVRDDWPASAPRFLDVRYRDLLAEPANIVRTILRHFGLPEEGDLDVRMGQYLRANHQERRRAHRYSLSEFGLRELEIRTVFERESMLSA